MIIVVVYLISMILYEDILLRYSCKYSFTPYKHQYDIKYIPIFNTLIIGYMLYSILFD